MSSEWPTVKLGDYCKKIGSGATPRGGANVYTSEGAICLIRSQNIYNEGFRPSGLVYIDVESADKLKNVTVEENDVLLNITGDSVARVCLAKKTFLPARVNQHVAIIRPHEKEFDPRFIRYLLASPAYQGILLSIAAVGATRNAITKGMIENLDVIKPPIKQQVKIADKLEALDDKIELNTQINQTLEQIAQALFKSWFVDFDPVKAKIAVLEAGGTAEAAELAAMGTIAAKSPEQLADMQQSQPEAYQQLTQTAALFPAAMQDSELGEIPEGWRVSTLKNLSEKISKGTTPRKADLVSANDPAIIPFVKVKDISNGNQIDKDNLEKIPASIHNRSLRRSILAVDDILFSIAGTIGRTYLVDSGLSNSNINQALAFIRLVNKENFLALVYLTLKSNHVQAEIKSKIVQGVQANASLTNISDIKILCPSNDILDSWNGLMSPIINDIRLILELNRKLSVIRDTLLPKLLSGAIDLAHINKSSPSNL